MKFMMEQHSLLFSQKNFYFVGGNYEYRFKLSD